MGTAARTVAWATRGRAQAAEHGSQEEGDLVWVAGP